MKKRFSYFAIVVGLLTSCGTQPPGSRSFLSELPSNLHTSSAADWRKEVIYLVLPDRFYNGDTSNDKLGRDGAACYQLGNWRKFQGGDVKGLTQKIGYLKDLGITAVWSTPLYEQSGLYKHPTKKEGTNPMEFCGYHGYWPNWGSPNPSDPSLTAFDPRFGTKTDVKTMIDTLHTNGMKFIQDQVVNHVGYDAGIISKVGSSWFNPDPCPGKTSYDDIVCPLEHLPDFNQKDPNAADFLTEVSKKWIDNMPGTDAVRMDTVKHVWPQYFKNSWVPAMRSKGMSFIVGELLDEDGLERYKTYLDTGFDSFFNFYLRNGFVESFMQAGTVDSLAGKMQHTIDTFGINTALNMVNIVDNHDKSRLTVESGLATSEDEIRRRYHMSLTGLLTLPGIPQLFYGDELGMYGLDDKENDQHRRPMKDFVWTAAGRSGASTTDTSGYTLPQPNLTFDLTKKLIALRKDNPALYQGGYAELWRQNGSANPNFYSFLRSDSASSNRIITAFSNGTADSGLISMNLQTNPNISSADKAALSDGVVFDKILDTNGGPSTVTITDGKFKLSLPGKSAAIYKQRQMLSGYNAPTFEITANTNYGEDIYLYGSIPEIGRWDSPTDPQATRAIKMGVVPGSCYLDKDTKWYCKWITTIKYLPMGTSFEYKYIKKSASVVYEGGSNRIHTVPTSTFPTVYAISDGFFR